jgi:hypothetical protein
VPDSRSAPREYSTGCTPRSHGSERSASRTTAGVEVSECRHQRHDPPGRPASDHHRKTLI